MEPDERPTQTIAAEPADSRGSGRWLLAWVLAVGLAVLTPLAVAGSWARSIVFDTDRYVATVGPLVRDPDVQAALTDQISTQVVAALDVDAWVEEALEVLPGSGLFLDGQPGSGPAQALDRLLDPLVGALEDAVRTGVGRVVTSEAFATAWEEANRSGHEQIVGALTGDAELAEVSGTQVSIRTEVFLDAVRTGLDDAGLASVAGLVPRGEASFVLFESDALAWIQAALRLLDVVGAWMWLVGLLVAVGVVLAAPRRRIGVMMAAGSVSVGALLLAGVLALARRTLVEGPGLLVGPDARAVLFDSIVAGLRLSDQLVLAVSLVVLLGAGVVGLVRRPGPIRSG